jgi:hypothetical protein
MAAEAVLDAVMFAGTPLDQAGTVKIQVYVARCLCPGCTGCTGCLCP